MNNVVYLDDYRQKKEPLFHRSPEIASVMKAHGLSTWRDVFDYYVEKYVEEYGPAMPDDGEDE